MSVHGRWNGVQVVPPAWVERSAEGVTAIHGESYGWLWWKSSFRVRGVAQGRDRRVDTHERVPVVTEPRA